MTDETILARTDLVQGGGQYMKVLCTPSKGADEWLAEVDTRKAAARHSASRDRPCGLKAQPPLIDIAPPATNPPTKRTGTWEEGSMFSNIGASARVRLALAAAGGAPSFTGERCGNQRKAATLDGVPLDVVYGPGAPQGIPLPELPTSGAVMDAFARAGAGGKEEARE